ncbi:MAG: four helix bundle protein [Candidatus Berkelbacteria bacterium]|nr:four helix bundle protein [Candidatus Berkelbacteria bacterium]
MPKCERFGLGHKIDSLFIDLLDIAQKTSFSPLNKKVHLLEDALSYIDSLRFFIQYCWELKLIPNNQFVQIGKEIENIGRMTGGWRKKIISKTSAEAEEKK